MVPTIIYNVPGITRQYIPPLVINKLMDHNPNFVGVQECVGNDHVSKYTDNGDLSYAFIGGADSSIYDHGKLRSKGS